MTKKPVSIELRATKEDAGIIIPVLQKELTARNLNDSNLVRFYHIPQRFVDHGQNPAGDSDLTPYFRVEATIGDESQRIYFGRGSHFFNRFITRDTPAVAQGIANAIQRYFSGD